MIITQQKPFDEIIALLDPTRPVVIVGCAACATKCKTGGDEEVKKYAQQLREKGYVIAHTVVLDTPCDMRIVRRDLQKLTTGNTQCVVLACGSGVQTIASVLPDVLLVPALDTVFIGATKRIGESLEFCSACGECTLWNFSGICPVTRCAKGMLNGPCGGMRDGKCEVDPERDCAWYLIFQKQKKLGTAYIAPKRCMRNTRISR